MRLALNTILIIMLLSGQVWAGSVSTLRQEMQKTLGVVQETEKRLNQHSQALDRERTKENQLKESLVVIKESVRRVENSRQSNEKKALSINSKLEAVSTQFDEERANYTSSRDNLTSSLKESLDKTPALLWTFFAGINEFRNQLSRQGFLEYSLFRDSQAYVEARAYYRDVAAEQVALQEELTTYTEETEKLALQADRYRKEKSSVEQDLKGTIQSIASTGQEIDRLRRIISSEVDKIRQYEQDLAGKLSGTNLPWKNNSKLNWPLTVQGRITSGYGWRIHPIFGDRRFHTGVDIAAATGTPILAAADGTVALSENLGGYGLSVVLDHGKGFSTLYAHASKLLVRPGQRVKRGDRIALVGNTGFSTGPHLHFEVQENTKHVDPMVWLN